jgi:hypothetical protein
VKKNVLHRVGERALFHARISTPLLKGAFMTKSFVELTKDEVVTFDAAVELTKAQLLQAVSIVSAVTGRDAEEVDGALVGAVIQALASNQAALVMSRRNFVV